MLNVKQVYTYWFVSKELYEFRLYKTLVFNTNDYIYWKGLKYHMTHGNVEQNHHIFHQDLM